jgi:hypothetical protein
MRRETIRIMVTLPIELDDILHQFGARARETGGYKISKTAIIRTLVRVFNDLNVNHVGVLDEKMLFRRIWEAIERQNKE